MFVMLKPFLFYYCVNASVYIRLLGIAIDLLNMTIQNIQTIRAADCDLV